MRSSLCKAGAAITVITQYETCRVLVASQFGTKSMGNYVQGTHWYLWPEKLVAETNRLGVVSKPLVIPGPRLSHPNGPLRGVSP